MKYAYTGALVTLAASATAQAQEVTIDLAGIGSWDALGAPDNIVLTESLPAGSIVNGVTDRCHRLWFGWPFLGQRDADGYQRGRSLRSILPS